VLRINGQEQESDRLVKEYVLRHPQSEDALLIRIEELIKIEPGKAKSLAADSRTKFPRSAGLAFDLGRIFQAEGKLTEAEQLFVEAAELSPESSVIQSWTGRFLFKVRNNKPRALDYYLNAYFLDPHAYETEFVESRISNLSWELAQAEIEKQTRAGTPLEKLLGDSNPLIVEIALGRMSENWKPSYLDAVLKCLEHDDGGVRWVANEAIKTHTDPSFDAQLKALLTDGDLRKRGLAAYLAVHRWKADSFPVIRRMLTEESELLRFDAVSALILEGGEDGRRLAFSHAASERNPNLRKLIEQAKKQKSDQP
jgi:tetratricopeptide (TPR) repeat protein